jgi:hypothetical protein
MKLEYGLEAVMAYLKSSVPTFGCGETCHNAVAYSNNEIRIELRVHSELLLPLHFNRNEAENIQEVAIGMK